MAVIACGTVSTPSLDTIENVTAIQLAYILEDERIGNLLVDAIDKLNKPGIRKKVNKQLAIKIAEVEEQESQFKKFDFTNLFNAITHDENLKTTGKASPVTEKALAQFKDYFKPKVVTKGRPFNMKDLVQASSAVKNPNWTIKQIIWFIHNVYRFLLGRVAASYGQAFSNGLSNPFVRGFKFKYYVDKNDLSYYFACRASSVADNFIVDIYLGAAGAIEAIALMTQKLGLSAGQGKCFKELSQAKESGLKAISRRLQPQTRPSRISFKEIKILEPKFF